MTEHRETALCAALDALDTAEQALGENLVWITDLADLRVRQKDAETLRRLKQLEDGWRCVLHALSVVKRAEG